MTNGDWKTSLSEQASSGWKTGAHGQAGPLLKPRVSSGTGPSIRNHEATNILLWSANFDDDSPVPFISTRLSTGTSSCNVRKSKEATSTVGVNHSTSTSQGS